MAVNGNRGGLNYIGVNATNPPNVVQFNRAPTVMDGSSFLIGDIWQYLVETPGTPPTFDQSQIYHLVGRSGGLNIWKQVTSDTPRTTINYQYFTTPGTFTYTPTTGMVQCVVECIGGGGSSAAVRYPAAGEVQGTDGGAAGGYCKKLFTAAQIGSSKSLTVGAGAAVTPNGVVGNSGSASTFGSFLVAHGGNGGGFGASSGIGGTATGGDINISGGNSTGFVQVPISPSPYTAWSGEGSFSAGGLGMGGPVSYGNQVYTDTQVSGTGYGSGVGGSSADQTVTQLTPGGAGQGGIIIITEYIVA